MGFVISFPLHPTHRILRQRRNRQTRIHPRIGRDNRAVNHVQAGVMMHLAVQPNHAILRAQAKRHTADEVRSRRDVQQCLDNRTRRDAVRFFGKAPGHAVADLDLRGDRVLLVRLRHQPPPEQGKQIPPGAHAHQVLRCLHHQHNRCFVRPARQDVGSQEVQWVGENHPQGLQPAHPEPIPFVEQGRAQRPHQPRPGGVAHRLNGGDGVGVKNRSDGDTL